MIAINFSDAKTNLKSYCEKAVDNEEEIIVCCYTKS